MATPQNLIIRRVPIEALHVDPANARSHPERNLAGLKGGRR